MNLEDLLKREHEPHHEALAVLDTKGKRIATMSVSIKSFVALRFAKQRLGGGGERLGMRLAVNQLSLDSTTRTRLGDLLARRSLKVAIDLPGGVSSSSLATPALKWPTDPALKSSKGGAGAAGAAEPLAEPQLDFRYEAHVDVAPGAASHMALLSALRTAESLGSSDEPDVNAEVIFTLIAVGSARGERDRELGSGVVSLLKLLATESDLISHNLPLEDESTGQPLGTLTISVHAHELLSLVQRSMQRTTSALAPPSLRSLVEMHVAKLRGVPPPLLSGASSRLEPDAKQEEALLTAAAAAAEGVAAMKLKQVLPKLDELVIKPLPALLKAQARKADESAHEHAARARKAVEGLTHGLSALSHGALASKSDFSHEHWPPQRIEKLYHGMALLSARAEASDQIARAAQHQLALQAALESAGARLSLSRYRCMQVLTTMPPPPPHRCAPLAQSVPPAPPGCQGGRGPIRGGERRRWRGRWRLTRHRTQARARRSARGVCAQGGGEPI